ncbi:MAG: RRXRR domain-containing protein, partial [Defluviitoga tunisiensis]
IQLLYETTSYTQNITLGIDSGYNYIGFSAVTEKEELICGEVKRRNDISETFMFKIETLEAEIFEKSF